MNYCHETIQKCVLCWEVVSFSESPLFRGFTARMYCHNSERSKVSTLIMIFIGLECRQERA